MRHCLCSWCTLHRWYGLCNLICWRLWRDLHYFNYWLSRLPCLCSWHRWCSYHTLIVWRFCRDILYLNHWLMSMHCLCSWHIVLYYLRWWHGLTRCRRNGLRRWRRNGLARCGRSIDRLNDLRRWSLNNRLAGLRALLLNNWCIIHCALRLLAWDSYSSNLVRL